MGFCFFIKVKKETSQISQGKIVIGGKLLSNHIGKN